jgi:hypothetical protein
MDMSPVHGGLPRFEERIFDKSLLMKGVDEVNNKWKRIQEEDEVEASNNSESTSSKPSSNHKLTKKSHLTFNAPALKEFNLVYSASEEEALLNYNQSLQRVPGIWKRDFDPVNDAHVPPIVMPLPNNVVGNVTLGVGLYYPPLHKTNEYVTENGDAPDKTT